MIGRETIRKVKEANSIEDVIARCGVPLKRSGEHLKARCPFADHRDSIPSFFVFPGTQRFQCFGQCGRGGDVLDFLQEWYGCTFREAVNLLSARTIEVAPPGAGGALGSRVPRVGGRTLPHIPDIPSDGDLPISEHAAILTVAGNIYHRCLLQQPRVLSYAFDRGILLESVKQQRLGYADGYTFPAYARRSALLTVAAKRCGLLADDGRETLSGRLVFPELRGETICYLIGRCVPPRSSRYKYLGLPIAKPLMGYGEAKSRVDNDGPPARGILIVEGAVDRIIALQWELPVYPVALIAAWPSNRQLGELLSLRERAGGATLCLSLDDDDTGHTATVALLNSLRSHHICTIAVPRTGRGKDLGDLGRHPGERDHYLPSLLSALSVGEQLS